MKKRQEIDEKYKWDFKDYFENDEKWNEAFSDIQKQIVKLKAFNNKLTDEESILKYFKLSEKCSVQLQAMYIYSHCKRDVDVSNNISQARQNKMENLLTEYGVATSFATPQLTKLDDTFLNSLLSNKKFADYSKILRDIIREKPHTLSEPCEKLMSLASSFTGDFSQNHSNFDDGDLKFKDIKDGKGKTHPMGQSLASGYLRNSDPVLRENAYKELQGAYGRYNNFLTSNYLGSVKKDIFCAKARNFASALDCALFYEDVSSNVYKNLIENVEKYLPLEHKYFAIKKKLLGLKTISLADVYYNPSKLKAKWTYEQALDLVCRGLGLLGEDYVGHIKHMAQNHMIDVYPSENKVGGAYQTMASRKTPRVLTNFVGSFNDVSTLAHELGHAMHSVYSDSAQSVANADYTIFLAEIASTVNETLLNEFMSEIAQSDKEKLFYLNEFLSNFHATVFRQTMFADFECQVHSKVENNEEISSRVLNETYLNLVKKFFGKGVKILPEVQYEWSRIPHFFNAFYVYKYATGEIAAINIVENLKSGKITVDDYKKFLSSGCTNSPTELLKIVKVDFDTSEPFDVAFAYVAEKLKQYGKLAK